MAIDCRPFTETERIGDYERRLAALVKRLIVSEPNVEQRCQLLDAWLELNPLPLTPGAQMEKLARYARKSEDDLSRSQQDAC